MNSYVLYFLAAIVIYMLFKNGKAIFDLRQNKKYIECFNSIKEKGQDAYPEVITFIENEKNEELIQKATFLKLFLELEADKEEYKNSLEKIDYKVLFYTKDKIDNQKSMFNSDAYIWTIICMARANKKSKQDVIDSLYEKLDSLQDLKQYLEANLTIASYKALKNEDDKGIDFFNALLNGEYTQYKYEKHFIASYKRIAAATLAYLNKDMDEYFKDDIKVFAETFVGRTYLSDLGIYDDYKVVE